MRKQQNNNNNQINNKSYEWITFCTNSNQKLINFTKLSPISPWTLKNMHTKHCESPKKQLNFSQLINSIATKNTQATMDAVHIKISLNRLLLLFLATNRVPAVQPFYSIFNKVIRLSFVCRFSIEFLLKQ